MGDWTFFSNYGHVLVCLARNREVRLRDVAVEVGITERAVQKIVRDLQDAGYLSVSKQGRCNRYRINRRKTLRHNLQSHCTVGKLLTLIARPVRSEAKIMTEAPEPEVTEPEVAELEITSSDSAAVEPPDSPPPSRTSKKPAKKEDESRPLDTRQQGNLF